MTDNLIEYYRESNINCYTGSLCKLLKNYGVDEEEHNVWLLGKGYKFIADFDEYNMPQLAIDIYRLVDQYLETSGFRISREVFGNDIKNQILEYIKMKPIIVWVNSKYLKYSEQYYGKLGYLHAIELEWCDYDSKVLVNDSFIVGIPPVSCQCIMDLDDLVPGLLDKVETDLYDDMGYIYFLERTNNKTNYAVKKSDCLRQVAAEILRDCNSNGSAILRYYDACKECISNSVENIFERINININQLYAIPSRNLLKLAILNSVENKAIQKYLLEKLNEIILQWRIISMICLKNARTQKKQELDALYRAFMKVDLLENELWMYIAEKL